MTLQFNNSIQTTLEKHIQSYVEELEQNRVNESIYNCPLDIFQKYCDVLENIDVCIPDHLTTYVALAKDVACWGSGKLHGIDVWSNHQTLYTFDIQPLQKGFINSAIQEGIQRKLPNGYYVEALDQTLAYNRNEVALRVLIRNVNKPKS